MSDHKQEDTADLVERARWSAASTEVSEELAPYGTMIDALADEIERLRGSEEAMIEGCEIIIELKQEIERLRALPTPTAGECGAGAATLPALEACPLCGDSALLQGLGGHNVICTNCNVLTPDYATAAEAIAAWNRRSSPCDGMGVVHASDCAIYNAPALPVGPCDCGAASDPCIMLRRALQSAAQYMKDAGAFMQDFPEITAALSPTRAAREEKEE